MSSAGIFPRCGFASQMAKLRHAVGVVDVLIVRFRRATPFRPRATANPHLDHRLHGAAATPRSGESVWYGWTRTMAGDALFYAVLPDLEIILTDIVTARPRALSELCSSKRCTLAALVKK